MESFSNEVCEFIEFIWLILFFRWLIEHCRLIAKPADGPPQGDTAAPPIEPDHAMSKA
jgi:hypothetical protein